MALIHTPFGNMIADPPEGMCPHGEAKCDDECQDFDGCKLDRPREQIK